MLAHLSFVGHIMLLVGVSQSVTKPSTEPSRASLASIAFDRAEKGWYACVQSERAKLSTADQELVSIESYIPTVCLAERQLVKLAIRELVRLSTSKQIDSNVESALKDRTSVLAQAISVVSVPAAAPIETPIPILKGSVTKGLAAFNTGDYETALARWLPKANAGNAEAQNNMGWLFENGLSAHTPQNDERAAEWYLLSARQGRLVAMQNLARVQTRLGFHEAASSWLNTAAAAQQQQAANQQQLASSLGYALGCAIGGGCSSGVTTYSQPTTTGFRPSTVIAPATPIAPNIRPRQPECRLSSWKKDAYGRPKIDCW